MIGLLVARPVRETHIVELNLKKTRFARRSFACSLWDRFVLIAPLCVILTYLTYIQHQANSGIATPMCLYKAISDRGVHPVSTVTKIQQTGM